MPKKNYINIQSTVTKINKLTRAVDKAQVSKVLLAKAKISTTIAEPIQIVNGGNTLEINKDIKIKKSDFGNEYIQAKSYL